MAEATIASAATVAAALWTGVGGDPRLAERLAVTGPSVVLPSTFPVTAAATGSIAAATRASPTWPAPRAPSTSTPATPPPPCAASATSRVVGTDLGGVWEPIAGDYPNGGRLDPAPYQLRPPSPRRRSACSVCPPDRDAVAAAVASKAAKRWSGPSSTRVGARR